MHFTAFLGQFGLSVSFQRAKLLWHSCIKHDAVQPRSGDNARTEQIVALTSDPSTISHRGQSVATLKGIKHFILKPRLGRSPKRQDDILSSANNNPGEQPSNFPGRWCRERGTTAISLSGWRLQSAEEKETHKSWNDHYKYSQHDDINQKYLEHSRTFLIPVWLL